MNEYRRIIGPLSESSRKQVVADSLHGIVGLRVFLRDGWARKWEQEYEKPNFSKAENDYLWRRYKVASRRYWDSIKELDAVKANPGRQDQAARKEP